MSKIDIVLYKDEYCEDLKRLSYEWLEKYNCMKSKVFMLPYKAKSLTVLSVQGNYTLRYSRFLP